MAKKIEIFENTLLKLLVRRGADADRQNVVLSEGELGYTTDTKRLFVGDGSTLGGIPIGGAYTYTNATPTNVPGNVGDLVFDIDNYKLYRLKNTDYLSLSSWDVVGGVYTPGNNTIAVSNTNQLSVGTLTTSNLSASLLGNSLVIDNNNKIALSLSGIETDTVTANTISIKDDTHLELPAKIRVGSAEYSLPTGSIGSGRYLTTNVYGDLYWDNIIPPVTVFTYTTAGRIPVGTIVPYISSVNIPYGWFLCNGQSLDTTLYSELCSVIGYAYGGSGASFNLPNLLNKTLYGVSTDPRGSTTYQVQSGANTPLSASGAVFIIKATPEYVASVSTTINSPLCVAVNDIFYTNTPFNPLSGNITIGLQSVISAGEYNDLLIDQYGRVIGAATPAPAGTSEDIDGTIFYNVEDGTPFLQSPVTIAEIPSNSTFTTNVSVYPYISRLTFSGSTLTGYTNTGFSIPEDAKDVIVETIISSNSNGAQSESIYTTALNSGLLTSPDTTKTTGTYEYLLNYSYSIGTGNNNTSVTQMTVPLSSFNGTSTLGFGLRVSTQSMPQNGVIRIVGYQ